MSIARKQGKRNRFDYTGTGKGIKINSASRADREWAEWNESQKWMTRWGRLTFCSFYSNSRELIRGGRYQDSCVFPSFDDKKRFKTLKFDLFKGQLFIRTVRVLEARRTDNSFAKKRSDFKLGDAVLVSCAKTVRRGRNENSEALCPLTRESKAFYTVNSLESRNVL